MEAGIAQNYDLKTVSKVIGTAVATFGIGAVPTGMKRYVTLVRTNNIAGANNTLYLCSAANSANTSTVALASAAQKYAIQLEAGESDEFPRSVPDTKHPLFTIAAGAYVNARTNNGNVRLFMQYFDQ
jgi:type IV secretory pathway TrbL component